MKIKNKFEKVGLVTMVSSFAIGSVLLVIYYFTMSEIIALQSYVTIIIVAFVNLAVLGILILKLFKKNADKGKILKSIGLMSLNIPVVIIYFYIFSLLLDTVRLTITNESNFKIENILVKGCEQKTVEDINPNKNATVWIKIPNDCSVSISYKMNGSTKQREILGYVTNMGGKKLEFKIGNK